MKNLFKPVTFTVALWQQICATLVMLWAIIIVTTSTFSYYIFAPSIRIADTIPTAILRNVLNNRVTILENRMIQMESRKRDSLKKRSG